MSNKVTLECKNIYDFIAINENNFVCLNTGEMFLGRYLKEEEFDKNMVTGIFNPKTLLWETFEHVGD